MLLVIDVGNTNMEFGVYRGEELVGSFRLMTDANRTSDELGLWLCQYFQRFGLELGQVEDVVIGSVAPQVMHTLSRAVQKYVGKTPLVLDEVLDPGLPYVECDSDERLGPDRAAADIAAIAKYGAPLVVLDFGTATTLDAVSREGVYLGGCITAGVQVSIDGLFQKTALLPRVELVGNRELRMENHRGILAYGTEEIHISGGKLILKIRGEDLELRSMNAGELLITGRIRGVDVE